MPDNRTAGLRGRLSFHQPLAPCTSWRIGGIADRYYCPADMVDLSEFLATLASDEPVSWLGLGSNVLVHDEGIRGVVIHTLSLSLNAQSLCAVEKRDSLTVIRAETGVTCAKLAKYCAQQGLVGAEFFAGIPGTVGGALAMNAGAWGGETWRLVERVEVMNRHGERFFRPYSDYKIGYRTVQGPAQEWFVAGYFQLNQGEAEQATQQIKALLRQRNLSQPIGVFSCGSVFKNPPGDYAGRLIEASGLKGFRIGDAQISQKHGNFIVNLGYARASDVRQLIEHIQNVVMQDHQIALQPEVRFLGFE